MSDFQSCACVWIITVFVCGSVLSYQLKSKAASVYEAPLCLIVLMSETSDLIQEKGQMSAVYKSYRLCCALSLDFFDCRGARFIHVEN